MASGDLGTFSVKDLDVAVGIYPITGFDDDMIRVSQNEDTSSSKQGASGEICRILRIKPLRTVVLSIMQTSISNDYLSLLINTDQLLNKTVPFIVKDRSGRTLMEAPYAWVKKFADFDFGGEHKVREWTLEAVVGFNYIGGNN